MQAFSEKYFLLGRLLFICGRLLSLGMVNEKALKTVANYAKLRDCHRNWVYQLIKAKKVKSVEIDGVLFIDTKPR